jgi:thiol-disulfide isomerase/thioredoxin
MARGGSVVIAVVLALVILVPGCLVDEEVDDGDGDDLPIVGTTQGFMMYDLPFANLNSSRGTLWDVDADFTIIHVISSDVGSFMPQFAQVRAVRQHFPNVTVEAFTLTQDHGGEASKMAELRQEVDADWTFAIPEEDLHMTLSITDVPTVFLLDADKVILLRSNGNVGQAWMVEAIERSWGISPSPDVANEVGRTAPELVWRDVDGVEGSLSALRGSPVLLNVWEYECPFCLQLFEELAEVHLAYAGQGLEMVSLDLITWETEELVRTVREEYNASWAFAVDGDNVQGRYDLWRLPFLALIDGDGVIRWTWTGYTDSTYIAPEVEKFI